MATPAGQFPVTVPASPWNASAARPSPPPLPPPVAWTIPVKSQRVASIRTRPPLPPPPQARSGPALCVPAPPIALIAPPPASVLAVIQIEPPAPPPVPVASWQRASVSAPCTLGEVGAISQTAQKAERISGICAVLAETDVINMVSRGIKTAEILRGIHESMAGRFVKLLRSSEAHGVVAVTGGLAADTGLLAAMRDEIAESGLDLAPVSHPQSVYAGAIGAALWGEFRFAKLNAQNAEARGCSS